MKTKITTFVMGMLMMASFMTSCDNHEPYDPDLHIGYAFAMTIPAWTRQPISTKASAKPWE